MLIALHVGQIWNQFWWHHLVVKFWTNTSGTTYNWPNLEPMQVEFYLAGEITQVIDSIPWVRCASGNVFLLLQNGVGNLIVAQSQTCSGDQLFWSIGEVFQVDTCSLGFCLHSHLRSVHNRLLCPIQTNLRAHFLGTLSILWWNVQLFRKYLRRSVPRVSGEKCHSFEAVWRRLHRVAWNWVIRWFNKSRNKYRLKSTAVALTTPPLWGGGRPFYSSLHHTIHSPFLHCAFQMCQKLQHTS